MVPYGLVTTSVFVLLEAPFPVATASAFAADLKPRESVVDREADFAPFSFAVEEVKVFPAQGNPPRHFASASAVADEGFL